MHITVRRKTWYILQFFKRRNKRRKQRQKNHLL